MKISMATVAYNALTEEVVQSALASKHEVELTIFTHSQDERIAELVGKLEGGQVSIKDYRSNRGVSKTWNEAIVNGEDADVTIIFNDDIIFSAGDVDTMADASVRNPDSFIITCAGWHEVHQARLELHGLSCFAMQKATTNIVGYFDQNFWPAYFEDNDLWRRCSLAGMTHTNCANTNVTHKGSYAIRNDPKLQRQNHRTFRQNERYYFRKWGGSPREEVFETPFNSPEFDLSIPKERIEFPYGNHDRPMPRLTRLI